MKPGTLLSICLLASSMLAFSVACQKPSTVTVGADANSSSHIAQANDPASAATVSGVVFFRGEPPKSSPIDMGADPACQGQNSSESLVAKDGKLQNVFVYLDGGFPFAPSHDPVVVEQKGCKYVPHVIAAAVMQPVEFRNLDATIHNIHGGPQANDAWNASQPSQAPAMTRAFSRAETMIPVKCNQHPWMKMYVNIANSPFFAVTDAWGHFELKGVPPGTYDVVFVQEILGQQRHSVTVHPREQAKIDVSFRR